MDIFNIHHSLALMFCSFHISLPALCQCQRLSQLQQSPVGSLVISSSDLVITKDATTNHWAFYFQGSWLPLSFTETWSDIFARFMLP